jgi:hypothetical protein
MTRSKSWAGSYLTLVSSSTRMSQRTHHGWPDTISYNIHKRGRVSFNSAAREATQFGDSICPVCVSTFKCLFNRVQPTWALIDTGGGYHLKALNFRSDHSSSIPSSILPFPPNYPARSLIMPIIRLSC